MVVIIIHTNSNKSVFNISRKFRLYNILHVFARQTLVFFKDGSEMRERPLAQDHIEPSITRTYPELIGVIPHVYHYRPHQLRSWP